MEMNTLAGALERYRQGKLSQSEAAAVAALQRRRAGELLAAGEMTEAIELLRVAVLFDPKSSRGHNNLGQALMQQRQVQAAIASYERAIACDSNYAIGHSNLGLALIEQGEFEPAETCLRRAVALQPSLAAAHLNLGMLLDRQERLSEALESYDRATTLLPRQFECWVGRGTVLAALGRLDDALQSFDSALNLRQKDALTLVRKASVMLLLERGGEALEFADRALQINPDLAEAHTLRAGALRHLHRLAEARACIDRALAADPAYVDGWCNRGVIAHESGDIAAAIDSYRRALALDPHCMRARVRLLSAQIPAVPESPDDGARARAAFENELRLFEEWLESAVLRESDAFTAARQQLFYLTYEEISNRALLRSYRQATAEQLARASRPVAAVPKPSRRNSCRHRVGFVSAHVYDHSVFNAILQGWLKGLDRSRFNLTLFNVGLRADVLTQTASSLIDQMESGPRSHADWVASIRGHDLDTLIYPEIGMDETTLALAHLRLAPRQCVSWGHPETSGLPTIDYFLSGEAFEPPWAEDHYTEKLIRLPNLGVQLERPATVAQRVDLGALNIFRTGPVYVCPGVPFKYRPQNDQVLVDIAQRLGVCTFVFFAHEHIELSNRLMMRLAAIFRRSNLDPDRFIVMIPWQPRSAFLGLLRQADVYLDTIGFSGFNTLMQAVQAGLPCVTYDGRFMRGRLGAGILRQLGITELIAPTRAEYIERAVRLGKDASYRAQVRQRIAAAEPSLYADATPLEGLSTWLCSDT
ncbi:MAG: tetratricopeptide repeat protein [Steroidobacteraceae bacterium]